MRGDIKKNKLTLNFRMGVFPQFVILKSLNVYLPIGYNISNPNLLELSLFTLCLLVTSADNLCKQWTCVHIKIMVSVSVRFR